METKRGTQMIMYSLLTVFLIGFVSAVTCAPADTIFKLSSATNAHAGDYASPYTGSDICYSTFFGTWSGTAGQEHTCTGTNSVVWLSSATNAHEASTSGTYTTEICYGDLDCVADSSAGTACQDTTRTVISRLSSATNAHAQDATFSTYPEKLCCKSTSAVTEPLWKDASGMVITEARAGDTIYPTLTNYNGNPDTTFDIYESDTLLPLDLNGLIPNDYPPTLQDLEGSFAAPHFNYAWLIDKLDIEQSGDQEEWRFSIDGMESSNLFIHYCGDGALDNIANGASADYESCDLGANTGQLCTPTYNGPGCSYCDANCANTYLDFPYCGDGNIDNTANGADADYEECDGGATNTDTPCDPSVSGGTCTYCTASGPGCQLTTINNLDMYWMNLDGGKITQAEVGDTVGLMYPGGSATTDTDFDVYEDDTFIILPLYGEGKNGPDDDITIVTGSANDPDFVGYWTITQGEYDASSDHDDYKFDIDGRYILEDDKLQIIQIGSNAPLATEILTPPCGTELTIGSNNIDVPIQFSISDPDDLVDYSLIVGGVEVDSAANVRGGTYSYTHTFTLKGTTTIRLEATNDRGQESTSISNIMVVDTNTDADYVAACINKPRNYEHISKNEAQFDASTSKAIKRGPAGNSDYSLTEMRFIWEFSDETTNPYTEGTDTRSYQFYKWFKKSDSNWAKLRVEVA